MSACKHGTRAIVTISNPTDSLLDGLPMRRGEDAPRNIPYWDDAVQVEWCSRCGSIRTVPIAGPLGKWVHPKNASPFSSEG